MSIEFHKRLGGIKIIIDSKWVGWKLKGPNNVTFWEFFSMDSKDKIEITEIGRKNDKTNGLQAL